VETYDLIIFSFVDHNLCVAILSAVIVKIPLQRLINATISNYVLGSECFYRIFLTVATAAVFDWRKYCSRDIFVAH